MKHWLLAASMLMTSTFSFAHQEMVEGAFSVPVKSFSVTESKYVDPNVVNTGYLVVRPMSVVGFSGKNLTKMTDAFKILEKVVNSEEFKTRFINFKNTKGQRAFASNLNLSNEKIFEIFMDGKETLQPGTPGEMNFYLKMYNSWWSRVIGWTSPTINTININQKYFSPNTVADVAANLAHEWTHKIGFDHKSAKEHDSVPYAIGYIVGDIAKKMLKNPTLY